MDLRFLPPDTGFLLPNKLTPNPLTLWYAPDAALLTESVMDGFLGAPGTVIGVDVVIGVLGAVIFMGAPGGVMGVRTLVLVGVFII